MAIYEIDGLFFWKKVEAAGDGATLLWEDDRGDKFYAPKGFSEFFLANFIRLACIGRGSTTAYYLNAAGKDFDHRRTKIFGVVDAWNKTQRGDGFINHERHEIEQWKKTAPKFSGTYMERLDFEQENLEILKDVVTRGGELVEKEVEAIRKWGDCYKITAGGNEYLAAKVIIATGAGPHIDVGTGDVKRGALWDDKGPINRALVLNLDEFMQGHPRTDEMQDPNYRVRWRGPVIAIHGTNAGIDAAQRAFQYGYDVLWFGTTRAPTWLVGARLPIERLTTDYTAGEMKPVPEEVGKRDAKIRLAKIGYGVPKLKPVKSDTQLAVGFTLHEPKTACAEAVDMYVISVGQDAMAEGAVGDMIEKSKIGWDNLEPIYDTNQIFGQTYQTILGFQVKGTRHSTGLQILGAAASGIAGLDKVKNNYREQYLQRTPQPTDTITDRSGTRQISKQEYERRLGEHEKHKAHIARAEQYLTGIKMTELFDHQVTPTNVPKNPPGGFLKGLYTSESTPDEPAAAAIASIVFAAQLGGVRAAMAALHGFMPEYIVSGSGANFTTDDRTMLAVYIAQKYPNIGSTLAEVVVQRLVRQRRGGTSSSLGYTDTDTEIEEMVLNLHNKT